MFFTQNVINIKLLGFQGYYDAHFLKKIHIIFLPYKQQPHWLMYVVMVNLCPCDLDCYEICYPYFKI